MRIRGSSGQEKPLFFKEKQGISSPRMTHWGEVVEGQRDKSKLVL